MTSASTLARQARAATDPKTAKQLRAKAAKLRREARAAKKPVVKATIKPKPKTPRDLASRMAIAQSHPLRETVFQNNISELDKVAGGTGWREADKAMNFALYGNVPGKGEVVGGELAKTTDRIMKMARSKKPGGPEGIQSALMMLEANAKYQGEAAAEARFRKERIEVNESYRDKIVCGFVAEAEDLMRIKGGIPADLVFSMNSFTLCRIVDALNAAGYTARGRKL